MLRGCSPRDARTTCWRGQPTGRTKQRARAAAGAGAVGGPKGMRACPRRSYNSSSTRSRSKPAATRTAGPGHRGGKRESCGKRRASTRRTSERRPANASGSRLCDGQSRRRSRASTTPSRCRTQSGRVRGVGAARVCIGHDVTEVVELVPAKLVVRRDVREKLACDSCDGEIVRAPARRQGGGRRPARLDAGGNAARRQVRGRTAAAPAEAALRAHGAVASHLDPRR